MKKLLALVLVLGFASISSAATIDISVNGLPWAGESVKPSDIITVIWSEAFSGFGGYGALDFNVTQGELGQFSKNTTGFVGNTLAPVVVGEGFSIQGGFTAFPVPAGELFRFDFHVPNVEPSTVIVLDTLNGGYSGSPYGAAVPGEDLWPLAAIHVIPEPMTMTLLALGGLALIRRR